MLTRASPTPDPLCPSETGCVLPPRVRNPALASAHSICCLVPQLDQTVQGNGKGYERLYKDPAVLPAPDMSVLDVTNNINVISTSFLPTGINIHFQTPYGIGSDPVVRWGYSADALNCNATGTTLSYDRTPPCSMMLATQCSSFFHNVEIPE
jgi:hypothetical protein